MQCTVIDIPAKEEAMAIEHETIDARQTPEIVEYNVAKAGKKETEVETSAEQIVKDKPLADTDKK